MFNNINDKFLIVLCLLKGRKFPKRIHHSLIAEARFDGEVLTSDPVEHVESPELTQELAWEIDRRALHQHKLQRSSVKVQFFCQETNNSKERDNIGYVILDLRSCSNSLKQNIKWHTLLHTKYPRSKPEVQLSLYIDEQQQQTKNKSMEFSLRSSSASISKPNLIPRLNPSTGCYEIGSAAGSAVAGSTVAGSADRFVFSVAVALAANLTQLLPTNTTIDPSCGFFFYYSLIGSDVTTQIFFDLSNPKFKVDRASVYLMGEVGEVRRYFTELDDLEIHLCCNSQVLGCCSVPISTLGNSDFKTKPATTEGVFQLHPLKTSLNDNTNKFIADELKPIVGVSIVLKLDDSSMSASDDHNHDTNQHAHQLHSKTSNIMKKKESHKTLMDEIPEKESSSPTPSPMLSRKLSLSNRVHTDGKVKPSGDDDDDTYTQSFDSDSKASNEKLDVRVTKVTFDNKPQQQHYHQQQQTTDNHLTLKEQQYIQQQNAELQQNLLQLQQQQLQQKQQQLQQQQVQQQQQHNIIHKEMQQIQQSQQVHQQQQQQSQQLHSSPHHFNLTIDLRSLSNFTNNKPLFIFLKYSYAFFGSTQPISTFPPVEVKPSSSSSPDITKVHQSFCSFDFAITYEELVRTFTRTPLTIEVYNTGENTSQHTCIGVVQVDMSKVLIKEHQHTITSPPFNQTCDWLPVLSLTNEIPLGNVQVHMKLEDWGSIPTNQVPSTTYSSTFMLAQQQHTAISKKNDDDHNNINKNINKNITDVDINNDQHHNNNHNITNKSTGIRGTLEYKTALELEIWKEEQKKLFDQQMLEKEKSLQVMWENEYKTRERERMVVVAKQKSEYNLLKEELRRTLDELERREKLLASNEDQLQRHEKELMREHETKLSDMKVVLKRSQADFDHKMALERSKLEQSEETTGKLRKELVESEARCQKMIRELEVCKQNMSHRPENILQADIIKLTSDKANLEKQLESLNRTKQHYKLQWTKALKVIGKYKERDLQQAKDNCRKQEEEVERLKVKLVVGREKEDLERERLELLDVRRELDRLKDMNQHPTNKSHHHDNKPPHHRKNMERPDKHKLSRMSSGISDDGDDDDDDFAVDDVMLTSNDVIEEMRITRLIEERDLLLKTGVYNANDSIITNLDDQIRGAVAVRNRFKNSQKGSANV